jgi:hypothetical protein
VPVFLKDDTSLLFMHVPKTGGTTVERLFRKSGFQVGFRATRRTEPALMPLRRCSPQHLHAELIADLLRVERFEIVFMLVRDPLARFRSEYAMRNKADVRTDSGSVERWAAQAFEDYARDPFVFDNHLRPQHEFELPATVVYRLEDGLEAAVADLGVRLGLDLPEEVPHALSREKSSGVSSRDVELSDALEERLRDFYRADFERFGY